MAPPLPVERLLDESEGPRLTSGLRGQCLAPALHVPLDDGLGALEALLPAKRACGRLIRDAISNRPNNYNPYQHAKETYFIGAGGEQSNVDVLRAFPAAFGREPRQRDSLLRQWNIIN